ncbi:MAG: putative nucleotidyltransferase substrate binding domain-containing protein, partial [Parachlamydiaceae bacterium]
MNPISTNKDTISLSLTNPTQALFGQLQQYIDQAEFDEALYELYHVFCDARSEDDIKQCYYILFELLPRCTSLGKLDFGVLENNLANLLNNPVFLVKEQQEQLALLLGRLYLKERKLKQAMVCFAKALQMNRSQGNYLAALEVFIHDFQSHKECRLGSFLINSTPSPDTIASHLKMLEALKAFGMPKEELLPFFQKTVRRMGSIPSEKHAAYQAHRQITRDLRDSSWELQQTPIERYWGALETFRACFANENPRTIQREAFDAMKALIALFIEDICTLIGPPPCHFDLRAMGSLGRKEMCLYSDLECMLLIADEQYRPYFIRMLELLELQIASLGETQDLPFVFTCIPNRSGFHLDSGTLNDERLMQTPIQMAEFQKRTTYIGNDIECTTLKTISLYQTTPQLYLDYQTHLQLIRKEFPFPFFDICNERIRDFSFEWKKHFNRAVFTYNIKKKFVETLYHPLSDLAVYLGIESTNTLEIAEALIDRQVLPEKMRDLLEESISLIYQIRIRNHIKHGTQNEEAHLSPEEVAILEKCYWRILVPLHTSLKKLVHSKELHRQYFEGLCQIDDPQALTKQLKGSTSILEAVLHLPDLSTTRPIYTMKIDALEASITAITEVFSPAVPGETSVQIKALHFPFTRFLRHSLAKKIMEGLDLKQEYTNSAHRVCRLQYGIHDLHFKQSPSNPLMEYAIQSLVSRIAGEYTPPTTLVRFDVEQQGQKKSYPVLISQTIPGENLKTAWPKVTPNRSYTWNLLVAILTRPQDGRISNYIFHEQDLFCVDNDLAFAEPVTRFGPFRTVHFSSAPFCLFPLTTPLDQEVLKEFVALDSVAICKAWVEEIIKKEKEYIQLFTEDERRTLYEKGDCTLTILLKKGCFSTLNFQFWQLQNVIQSAINQKEPLIVENLLKQLVNLKDEKVGDYVYRAYNSDKGTPEEKLERALERRRDTSVTCVEYHKNCLGKIPSFNEIKTLEKYSLKQAKNELFNAFLIESEHAYLKDSQGKSALGANFKELNDPNRETKILVSMNEIIKRSPKKIFSLSFYYSTVLDNRQIESFLHPDLEKIELRHCSNIDNSTVRLIQKKCPQLKELILTGCPKITELGESLFTSRLTFTHLETLEISHTPCTTLIFTAPKLRSLSISYNLALIDLDFEAPSLLQINVKKSDKIRLLP